jgi:hypothetical protein
MKYMNPTKMIFSVTISGAIALGAMTSAKASFSGQPLVKLPMTVPYLITPSSFSGYPLVKLNISGSLIYTTNLAATQKVPLKTLSYTTQTLINLLNASPTASNQIQTVTGTNQIPKGSYFIWDPGNVYGLYLTNNNGFFFPLEGSGYDFGYLEVANQNLIGTVKYASTWALNGTETDSTGIIFYFGDGPYENSDNKIELYGVAALNWTYGIPSGGNQKASVSVTMTGNGNNDCFVNDFAAIPASFSASGSGSIASMPTDYQPFFFKY